MGYLESRSEFSVSKEDRGKKSQSNSLSTDTDTIDEQTPCVTNGPSAESCTPHGSQHEQTEKHDQSILYQSESSTNPVSLESNEDLADHDTNDLEVSLSSDPVLVTSRVVLAPTVRPDSGKERGQISDRKQGVTFGEESETVENVTSKVCGHRGQGVFLDHASQHAELSFSFLVGRTKAPSDSLT